jgi:glycogen synthase
VRILMLSWEYPPHIIGGLGRHVTDLATALATQHIEMHVVTPNLGGGPEIETIGPRLTVHRAPVPDIAHDTSNLVASTQSSNRSLQRKALELHAQLGGFELIHGHDWLVAPSSIALKYALNRPFIATIHSIEHGRRLGNLADEQARAINDAEGWLTHEAWRIIAASTYMARQICTLFKVPRDKLDIIPNGVVLPRIPAMNDDERLIFRQQYARPDEKIVYYVGRLVYEKGVQVLIDAACQLLHEIPQLKFVIAGTGSQHAALQIRAQASGVASHFIFTGFISDDVRDKLYQVADVAVFPSLYEPFGIVALEAMAYRCPVVASATGGLIEVVRSHETGIVTQPGNPASLAWGILHTLQYPEWARARTINALRELEMIYNWNRIAAQTLETYQRTYSSWLENL